MQILCLFCFLRRPERAKKNKNKFFYNYTGGIYGRKKKKEEEERGAHSGFEISKYKN